MIANLKTWFDGRSQRERRLLLVMVALAALTLLWGGIIRPLTDALLSAQERHASAVIRLGETQSQVAALHVLQQNRPEPIAGPLVDILRNRANEAGFPLSLANPMGNDRVQIAITAARPGALLGWVSDLERSGILVDSFNATNNGDKTIAVQMTLKARGV